MRRGAQAGLNSPRQQSLAPPDTCARRRPSWPSRQDARCSSASGSEDCCLPGLPPRWRLGRLGRKKVCRMQLQLLRAHRHFRSASSSFSSSSLVGQPPAQRGEEQHQLHLHLPACASSLTSSPGPRRSSAAPEHLLHHRWYPARRLCPLPSSSSASSVSVYLHWVPLYLASVDCRRPFRPR